MQIFNTLKTRFGFNTFRKGQEEVIRKLLAGRSALAIFPTGSGKSLCYQLTALHLDHLTVVVSPLIALMKDQIDFLTKKGIPAARLDSTVSSAEFREIIADLRTGHLKLIYLAPERFANERFVQSLKQIPISLMVIDEAHCISEWGHNFRPDYLRLAKLSQTLGIPQVLALTATATPAVAADIAKAFRIEPDACIQTGFHRPNLEIRVTPCNSRNRSELLLERLKSRPAGSTIVYVTLQKSAEELAARLASSGIDARPYHAGMGKEERAATQDWFMQSKAGTVVATIAFGMGIDKADIRYVYHYNLPKSLENYSQEIGRAGRDGNKSICELLAVPEDRIVLENFTYGDTPTPEAIRSALNAIFQNRGEFDLSVYQLSREHDLRPIVATTLLTYLELEGAIESTGPFYEEYQFAPLVKPEAIFARFDQNRAVFLRKLFQTSKRGTKWMRLNPTEAAGKLHTDRGRIVRALSYLEEKGDLVLQASKLRVGYRTKTIPENLLDFSHQMIRKFALREQNDLARIDQVIGFSQHSDCLVLRLLDHFGEKLDGTCGHCDRCLGNSATTLPTGTETARVPAIDPETVLNLRLRNPEALNSPRQFARFLCGLTSPFLARDKLTQHPLYGSLSGNPFRLVEARIEEILGAKIR